MKAKGLRNVLLMAAAGILISGQEVSAEKLYGGEGNVTAGEMETGETALPEGAGEGEEWQSDYAAAGVYANGEVNDIKWSIDMNGKLTVTGTGDWGTDVPWGNYRYHDFIKSAEIKVTGMTNAYGMFLYCSNLTNVDFSGLDTSRVTDMGMMFGGCSSLKNLELSSFNTSSVQNMNGMFFGCSSLENLNLRSFDTSGVQNMGEMFEGCRSLESLDLSSFDIMPDTNTQYMLILCDNLKLINAPRYTGQDVLLPGVDRSAWSNQVWRFIDGTETETLPKELNHSVEVRRYDLGFASYEGYDFYHDENWNVICTDPYWRPVINEFKCDGTYTYYFQADGTAMKDRLTYHPDGEHVIYFDKDGHEIFSNFANVRKSIEGKDVDDYCFFDVLGYMYVDVVTYDETGTELLYANPYGVLEHNGWFRFSDTVKCADGTPWPGAAGGYGYATEDFILLKNTEFTDWNGRPCYIQGNGVAVFQ